MERGLLWLPLLAIFLWLAWAGRNEYRKVEAYKVWATPFDRAKYDIKSVLGQSGNKLTWGLPDREHPQELLTFSLQDVKEIRLLVDGQIVDPLNPPSKAKSVALEFVRETEGPVQVPFTQLDLAVQWGQALAKDWQKLRSIN
jgi:hypothetical protein